MKWIALALLLVTHSWAKGQEPVIGGPCEGCELVFVGMPKKISAESVIASSSTPGQAMILSGRVRTRNQQPAEGIIVYAYHTNATGVYPRGTTRHGALRGWAKTDTVGRYSFRTIRPAAYPGTTNPQHVHMHVIEPGRGTYYIDDVLFLDDPLLTSEHRELMVRGRGGSGLSDPKLNNDGIWHIVRDITLGENIPDYDATTTR
jgi:protocatechuate 3,4-dioxygenase beta subunit